MAGFEPTAANWRTGPSLGKLEAPFCPPTTLRKTSGASNRLHAEGRQATTEAMAKAEVLALRVLAEQLEHGEVQPIEISISLPAAA